MMIGSLPTLSLVDFLPTHYSLFNHYLLLLSYLYTTTLFTRWMLFFHARAITFDEFHETSDVNVGSQKSRQNRILSLTRRLVKQQSNSTILFSSM